jgi:ubiquinone/menaquinone biosynthesis C-methylase UbiE
MTTRHPSLDDQIAYYRARASEYDQWFERRGRYDHGEAHRQLWNAEAKEVRGQLREFHPRGAVLELAGGTGIWSQHLLQSADSLDVLDASVEMLSLNRQRCAAKADARSIPFTTQESDLFTWTPDRTYDVVFFSFWLSHVPQPRFDAFWETVRQALAPGGRVFFIDSKLAPQALASDHPHPDVDGERAIRRLNDGREYEIVKRFYDPSALSSQLQDLGFHAHVTSTRNFFIIGEVSLA